MSKRIFNQEQITTLLQNPNVARCSEKSISYYKDFKTEAVRIYRDDGLSPNQIFRDAGFDINMIGREVPGYCLHRWLKVFKMKGIGELSVETRGRGKGGGRPKTNWSNENEKLKHLEAQVAYLKAENAFLAKLRKQRLN